MKSYNLTENERATSGYTDLTILSFADGDFSAAGTTQTYALAAIATGDIADYPLAKVYVKTGVVGTFSAPLIMVGYDAGTDDLDFLLGATAGVAVGVTNTVFGANALSAVAGGPVTIATAATMVGLVATLTVTGANISTATAGEIHIYTCVVRGGDHARVNAG
jgi:hypothetical protein